MSDGKDKDFVERTKLKLGPMKPNKESLKQFLTRKICWCLIVQSVEEKSGDFSLKKNNFQLFLVLSISSYTQYSYLRSSNKFLRCS